MTSRPALPRYTLFLPAAIAVGLFALGCTSVAVHGVIQTPDEQPVAKASVALQTPQSDKVIVTGSSDTRGCFNLFQTIPRHHGDYQFSVALPGYKPVSLTVNAGPDNLVLVTLEPATGDGSSSARPISSSERYLRYATPCEPLVNPGSSLTLH
jgi:hypothetical protein